MYDIILFKNGWKRNKMIRKIVGEKYQITEKLGTGGSVKCIGISYLP